MEIFRKYYVPGLISLFFLPIVFVFFGLKKLKEPRQYALEMSLYPLQDSNEFKKYFLNNLIIKNSDYIITNDKNANEKILKDVFAEFYNFSNSNKDDVSIRIKIHDETFMQEYVNLYEWIYDHDIKRYAIFKNYLYLRTISNIENEIRASGHCVIYERDILQKTTPNTIKMLINTYWHNGKEILVLYFLFLLSIIAINIRHLP